MRGAHEDLLGCEMLRERQIAIAAVAGASFAQRDGGLGTAPALGGRDVCEAGVEIRRSWYFPGQGAGPVQVLT